MKGKIVQLIAPNLYERLAQLMLAFSKPGLRGLRGARERVAMVRAYGPLAGLAFFAFGAALSLVAYLILIVVGLLSGSLDSSGSGTLYRITVQGLRAYGDPAGVTMHYVVMVLLGGAFLFFVLRPFILEAAGGLVGAVILIYVAFDPAQPNATFLSLSFLTAVAVTPLFVSLILRLPVLYYLLIWTFFAFPAQRSKRASMPPIEAFFAWGAFIVTVGSLVLAFWRLVTVSRVPPLP